MSTFNLIQETEDGFRVAIDGESLVNEIKSHGKIDVTDLSAALLDLVLNPMGKTVDPTVEAKFGSDIQAAFDDLAAAIG